MHTAEHLLNQAMVRLLGTGRCFSAHIEKKKSKCDYHFSRDLDADELKKVEDEVNQAIAADLPVKEEYVAFEDARKEYDLSRLPATSSGDLRIIKIGDYDACPCRGVHAVSTGELFGFKIISHSFENGVLRLRYKLKKED